MLGFDQLQVGKTYRLTERQNPSGVRLLHGSIGLNETVTVRVLRIEWGSATVEVTSKSVPVTQTLPQSMVNSGYLELA